ncbi:MAG: DUF362 domain-containing protein, partial [Thermodesulfobacteriota bacterium]|nr:DUF362 domain-containing protein [Thermodesulfobacteriota bacterium]
SISRRRFLKNTMVTGAAISAFPSVFIRKAEGKWTQKSIVHPNVDNLRVVSIIDQRMTQGKNVASPWKSQEKLVVTDVVWENIDKLACALVQTKNSHDAWKGIFIKPPIKSWSDTVVAIKTNNIAKQHTRSAVMGKICHTLTDTVGIKPTNIHIYDAVHGKRMSTETPFSGLPEGCRIEDRWGGITRPTYVSSPNERYKGKTKCLKHLVTGHVDILINIAMCKGHSERFGGFTMTMKNHLGTFSPAPAHQGGDLDYVIAINQSSEILGPMNKKTGVVLYPRQQLCLIDGLWASKGGPGGYPTDQPNFLAMGVMSPAVDYQVATKFRDEKMGWNVNRTATRQILTDFGYTESDLPHAGKLIEL